MVVVVYQIKKNQVYIADPALGLIKYSYTEFESQWATTIVEGEKTGIALLLEPTQRFYQETDEQTKGINLSMLSGYLFKYKRLILQLFLGLFIGSILQLILPFLTQSVVDTGIQTRNLHFIYLVLAAQLMLFIGRMSVEFIRSLLPAARKAASSLGLDPLALIAQAALETGWGKLMIKTASGDNSFNLFGIKASRNWQGDTAVVDTLEYRQGVARKEQAKFRAYTSPEDSLRDYTEFIANSLRYQQAVAAAAEPAAYFSELQAAGYATDPNYAQKIMSVYRSTAFEQVRAELESTQDFAAAADE